MLRFTKSINATQPSGRKTQCSGRKAQASETETQALETKTQASGKGMQASETKTQAAEGKPRSEPPERRESGIAIPIELFIGLLIDPGLTSLKTRVRSDRLAEGRHAYDWIFWMESPGNDDALLATISRGHATVTQPDGNWERRFLRTTAEHPKYLVGLARVGRIDTVVNFPQLRYVFEREENSLPDYLQDATAWMDRVLKDLMR